MELISDLSDSPERIFTNAVLRRSPIVGESYNPEADISTDIINHPKSELQREMLAKQLQNLVFMKHLDGDQLRQVLNAFFPKTVSAGDCLIMQGEEGRFFYVVEKGRYQVFVATPDGVDLISTFEDDGSFGELALLYSTPRVSVRAETDGLVWALERKTFQKITIKSAHVNRSFYDECLKNVPILSHLSDLDRMKIVDVLVPYNFKQGDYIMKEFDVADGMHLVIEGEVEVHTTIGGEQIPLQTVERGGHFGEMALLDERKRTTTAVANGDVKTVFLSTEGFIRLLGPLEDNEKTT